MNKLSTRPIKLKVAVFRKCNSFFRSPNLKKKYSKKLSRAWNLNFPPITLGVKSKFQAQDSFLEHFFWRIGDLKKFHHTFWKKLPLGSAPPDFASKTCFYDRPWTICRFYSMFLQYLTWKNFNCWQTERSLLNWKKNLFSDIKTISNRYPMH